jgi:hypothetical protein
MAKAKAVAAKRKTLRTPAVKTQQKDDLVTITYGTVVFYVFIGLIIGMAIGALSLLWVVRSQQALGILPTSAVTGQLYY